MKIFFLKALFLSFLLIISDVCFVLAADKKSPAKNSNAFTKTEQKAVHDLNKAFKVMRNMNHSSAQSCKLDDDVENAGEPLATCQKPVPIAAGCMKVMRPMVIDIGDGSVKEDFSSTVPEEDLAVIPSNIVKMDCSVCGLSMQVYGRMVPSSNTMLGFGYQPMSRNDVKEMKTYDQYYIENMYTKTDMETVKSTCLNLIENGWQKPAGRGFFGDPKEQIEIASSIQDIISSDVNAQPILWGPVTVYPTSFENKCIGQEQSEVIDYADQDKTSEPAAKNEEERKPSYTPGSITNNGKTLGVSGLPTLKGVFDYQLHGDEENKEDMEYRLNMFVDPGVILRKSVGQHAVDQRKLRLTAEDEQSYVHHLVFDKKAASIEEILPVLNREANKMRGLVKPRCEADQVEHLNVTTSQADGTSVTQRYILKCEMKNGKRVLSVSDLKK